MTIVSLSYIHPQQGYRYVLISYMLFDIAFEIVSYFVDIASNRSLYVGQTGMTIMASHYRGFMIIYSYLPGQEHAAPFVGSHP